jgi:hypothetical protein
MTNTAADGRTNRGPVRALCGFVWFVTFLLSAEMSLLSGQPWDAIGLFVMAIVGPLLGSAWSSWRSRSS